jgi:methionine--tRNA ligase beta chain
MSNIDFGDFTKLDIRVGKVIEASDVESSQKLIRCVVDFGAEIGQRIIYSGIRKWYSPKDIVGRLLPYVINLSPKKMPDGGQSEGMLLAVSAKAGDEDEERAVLLEVNSEVAPGSRVI